MNTPNKKIIVIVAAIILLMLLFFVTKGKQDKSAISNEKAAETSQIKTGDEETVTSGSLLDLIKSGNTAKCTYSTKDETTQMTGTTYVSGKNMRSDSSITTADGTKMETHMISDGTWAYTWTSATPQGFKMKIDDVNAPKTNDTVTETTNNSSVNFADKYDFRCSKWGVDQSKFVVPSDITFTDYSKVIENLNNNGSACAACDYAQDAEAKAQCKAQLGCE